MDVPCPLQPPIATATATYRAVAKGQSRHLHCGKVGQVWEIQLRGVFDPCVAPWTSRKAIASAQSKNTFATKRALQNYFCNKIGQKWTRAVQ